MEERTDYKWFNPFAAPFIKVTTSLQKVNIQDNLQYKKPTS